MVRESGTIFTAACTRSCPVTTVSVSRALVSAETTHCSTSAPLQPLVNSISWGDGRQRDGRVPVVRRGDEDGVDIGALQEFLVVQICFGALGIAGGLREPLAIYVAHRDHLDISTRLLPAQASFQVI